MINALLGNHKPSSNWYTPDSIWERVESTFMLDREDIYDPCPVSGSQGLATEWEHKWSKFLYINPPTPAAPWALKAIQTHLEHPEVNIIFACFSEAVLWQVNDLMDSPVCWVRNRISWIDGNRWVKVKHSEIVKTPMSVIDYTWEIIEDCWHKPNPNYLKPAKSPRNYNAFVCLSADRDVIRRFCENFESLGTIRQSFDMSVG